ncbi:MAG: hypothetical protein EOP45_11070 [Sphingobacteriaceae bacterium]|nr:MAG: hypothetical protein EOP45_11070 [Sphingobacteriaceae bacterium]
MSGHATQSTTQPTFWAPLLQFPILDTNTLKYAGQDYSRSANSVLPYSDGVDDFFISIEDNGYTYVYLANPYLTGDLRLKSQPDTPAQVAIKSVISSFVNSAGNYKKV